MSFTILTGKEGATPKKPLFLVSIAAADTPSSPDMCYLTTAAYYGAPNISYGGNSYLARILKNDLQAIQAMGPQGYDSVPGFSLAIADADKFIWTNHCVPHGWRGAVVTLTAILWDVVTNAYSTDAIQWTFIGGNPQHDDAEGQTTLDVTSFTNFTRLKVPSVPLSYTCPWDFPATLAQRTAALNDPSSVYYQCGYSADVSGGVGNLTGGIAFTGCDKTRSGGPGGDPSVGCMARLGNAATTSRAPDGDLTKDKAGHYTARFGGVTWIAPSQYSGRAYVSGQKTFGFNPQNTSIIGQYFNWVYGTQWVSGMVLAPAGDPNSLRSEVVLCFAPFGPVTVWQVLVNGVMVPQNNSDPLFTWRFNSQPGSPGNTSQGGRAGALCGDAYFSSSSYSGLSDPHGSMCVIEFVVPAELAAPGSTPSVQALVSSGPMLTVTSGGAFVLAAPNLYDPSLYDISTQDSIATGPAANPVFVYLDLMAWGNIATSQVNPVSWYAASQIAAIDISYVGADGGTYSHAQYKACLQLPGNSRATLASVLIGLRNSANMMVGPNVTTGLIDCYIKQTLHDQQGAAISGSNDSTAIASFPATNTSGVPSLSTPGYYAYWFNETNIEEGSFKVTSSRIESTPNTVAFSFEDEYNSYQTDSLTEVDPNAYAYSGNQEVNVPVPVNAIPNFDQGTRIANTQLAEALYGNPRNDAGGTLYFEFRVNMRVIHLAGRLGYICGLTWQTLGIGVTVPQAIRILSLKPDTDGEHWQVKAAWHSDEWYTYAYGQNPTPYQKNPLLGPRPGPPYPWQPGQTVWSSTDALFPNILSFAFWVDLSQTPAQLLISGTVPNNSQPTTTELAPLVPLQASQANSGGTIPPGTYQIAFSPGGVNGPMSNFVSVTVQPGTNTNTITVANIQWKSGAAPSIQPFIGTSYFNMRACASASYTGSSPDSSGNPTSYTFTAITPGGVGMPDLNFSEFLVEETTILHGGVWGDAITTVAGPGHNNLLFSGAAASWTVSQWTGYVLSLYYRPGLAPGTPQPGLNMAVTSSGIGNLTVTGAGFIAGDVVVLRAKSSVATASAIGDPNFVNSYATGGLTVNAEIGNLVQIIAGTGAWTTPKSIISNTSTVLTIKGSFDITPDATSIFIVIEPTVVYAYYTQAFTGTGSGVSQIAATPAITTQEQSLLVTVFTCDVNGNASPQQYQPSREVYIPPQPPDPPVFLFYSATAQTLTPNAQIVSADASSDGMGGGGGNFTITIPPMAEWVGEDIVIIKIDSGANVVTWQLTSPDVITSLGGATSGTLMAQGDGIELTAVAP